MADLVLEQYTATTTNVLRNSIYSSHSSVESAYMADLVLYPSNAHYAPSSKQCNNPYLICSRVDERGTTSNSIAYESQAMNIQYIIREP